MDRCGAIIRSLETISECIDETLRDLKNIGNETKLSAHNEANEWEFVSKNKNTGKCVKVNMEKMIKRLEELHPGENFLEEWTE